MGSVQLIDFLDYQQKHGFMDWHYPMQTHLSPHKPSFLSIMLDVTSMIGIIVLTEIAARKGTNTSKKYTFVY